MLGQFYRAMILAGAGGLAVLLVVAPHATAGSIVLAQADGKSASDRQNAPRPPAVARPSCGNIVGTWSWTGGLFGANDTQFNADGTAVHRSGITGTWTCRPGGEIYIDWKDWYKNRMKLSADGKTLENLEGGGAGFRR